MDLCGSLGGITGRPDQEFLEVSYIRLGWHRRSEQEEAKGRLRSKEEMRRDGEDGSER